MLIHYINKYGAEPYDSYEDPKEVNYTVLCRKVEQVCRGAIARRVGIEKLRDKLDELFDAEIGYLPAKQIKPVHCFLTDKKQTFNRKCKDFFLKTVFRDDRGCIRFFHI